MAARLTDKQKKKIIVDYLELGSYNATARLNGVCDGTVKRVVESCGDIRRKIEEKNEQNTADILAYMESKRGVVCEIIDKGLMVLNDSEKLSSSTPAQITTAIGTLIDKFTMAGKQGQEVEDLTALADKLK